MKLALGASVHTGWAAAVVAGGSLARPTIAARAELSLLGDSERFVYHLAADMEPAEAAAWVARARAKALAAARRELAALLTDDVVAIAVVARPGSPGELATILAAHPKIHTAEGCRYRDVLVGASPVPAHVVPPSSLDPADPRITKLVETVDRPWSKDQRLATLAAWKVLARP